MSYSHTELWELRPQCSTWSSYICTSKGIHFPAPIVHLAFTTVSFLSRIKYTVNEKLPGTLVYYERITALKWQLFRKTFIIALQGEPNPPSAFCPFPSPFVFTLFKLRAALSFPPGVRFRSCTSSKFTSWTMADTEYAMSPAYKWFFVCSASSRAMLAAISPDFICNEESRGKGCPWPLVWCYSSPFQPHTVKWVNSPQEEEEERRRGEEKKRGREEVPKKETMARIFMVW